MIARRLSTISTRRLRPSSRPSTLFTTSPRNFAFHDHPDTALVIALRNAIHHRNYPLFRTLLDRLFLDDGEPPFACRERGRQGRPRRSGRAAFKCWPNLCRCGVSGHGGTTAFSGWRRRHRREHAAARRLSLRPSPFGGRRPNASRRNLAHSAPFSRYEACCHLDPTGRGRRCLDGLRYSSARPGRQHICPTACQARRPEPLCWPLV